MYIMKTFALKYTCTNVSKLFILFVLIHSKIISRGASDKSAQGWPLNEACSATWWMLGIYLFVYASLIYLFVSCCLFYPGLTAYFLNCLF